MILVRMSSGFCALSSVVKSVVTHLNHELTRAVYELRVWLTRARSAENPFELP